MASSAQTRPAGSVVLFLTSAAFQSLSASWQNLDQQFSVPLITVGNCAALGPLPPNLSFNGLELMLDIGSSCTRPDIFDDPSPLFALFKDASTIAGTSELKLKADIYYREASAVRVVGQIRVPTLIVTAQDDPFIPFESFHDPPLRQIASSRSLRQNAADTFISRHGGKSDSGPSPAWWCFV